jgi:hypothetical protein
LPGGNQKKKLLTINPVNLIMLNIDSYAGGIRKMWDKSKEQSNSEAIIGAKENHTTSSPFDGKIEFLSFKNRCYFGLCERGCTGGGMRISQGIVF